MKLGESIRIAARNLKKRKGRTFLTALGVIIGISAVLTITALSTGLQDINQQQFSAMGDIKRIQAYPNYKDIKEGEAPAITEEDIATMYQVPGVRAVLPNIMLRGDAKVSYSYYSADYASIQGFVSSEVNAYEYDLVRGRYPEKDNEVMITETANGYLNFQKKKKATSGTEEMLAKQVMSEPGIDGEQSGIVLPSSFDLLGRKITLVQSEVENISNGGESNVQSVVRDKTRTLEVVGIMKKQDGYGMMSRGGLTLYMTDGAVENLQSWYKTGAVTTDEDKNKKKYEMVEVIAADEQQVAPISQALTAYGYDIFSLNTMIESFNEVFSVVKIVLGGIAAIALLVATINIMNTMYMSVLERNKEIGVMKVLGAPISSIRQMFLCEAGFIGFTGGLVGLILGELLTLLSGNLLASIMSSNSAEAVAFPFKFDLVMIAGLLVISTIIGMIAGFLPANRAAKISPLEAIRNE